MDELNGKSSSSTKSYWKTKKEELDAENERKKRKEQERLAEQREKAKRDALAKGRGPIKLTSEDDDDILPVRDKGMYAFGDRFLNKYAPTTADRATNSQTVAFRKFDEQNAIMRSRFKTRLDEIEANKPENIRKALDAEAKENEEQAKKLGMSVSDYLKLKGTVDASAQKNAFEQQRTEWEQKSDSQREFEVMTGRRALQLAQQQEKAEEEAEEEKKRTWFQADAFKDGFDWYDIPVSIGATLGDIGVNAIQGAASMGEGIIDFALYAAASNGGSRRPIYYNSETGEAFDNTEALREAAQKDVVGDFLAPTKEWLDKGSFLGDKSDSVAQGLGQIGGIYLTGGLGGVIGGGTAGASAFTTGSMFLSSAGQGVGEAYQSGASEGEAWGYGILKGIADAGSELIFGGLGKGVNALGVSRGLTSLDDMFAKKLSEGISNQVVKNFVEFGVKSSAEGFEEVLAGLGTAFAQKLTYMTDEELLKLVDDQDLLEQFVVGTVSSALVQSGYLPGPKKFKEGSLRESNKTGRDFITGYTQSEQSVIDRELADRIAELEKDGEELSEKDKKKLLEEVQSDVERGFIDTDKIEEILGGDRYTAWKDADAKESKLIEEYEMLADTPSMELSRNQQKRLDELEAQIESLRSKPESTRLRGELSSSLSDQLKNSRLNESYNERVRRREKFVDDVSKYESEAAKKSIQNLIDIGYANNSNAVHDFAENVAKMAEASGQVFSFVTDEKLREMGKAKEGRRVNGFIDENGITVNLDSRAWEFVVGHEVTHAFDKAKSYGNLHEAIKAYAEQKGEWNTRLAEMKELYEGQNADAEAELVSDLVGEYLFGDADFINNLSTKHQNVFQKMYAEIKHLLKMVTAGSKQARQLERAKHAFEKAMREGGQTSVEGTKHSLSGDRSLSKDSDGQKLAKGQIEYFKDSKARDENGALKLVYHASPTAGYTVFDGGKGNGNYRFGKHGGSVTFFTDSKEMSDSYAPSAETMSTKRLNKMGDARVSGQYEGYLNLKNPYVVDAEGRYWSEVEQEFSPERFAEISSTFTSAEKSALIDLASWENLSGFREEINEAVKNTSSEASRRLARAYNKFPDMEALYDMASDGFSDESIRRNAMTKYTTNDIVERALKDGSYDGVIIKNVVDYGGHAQSESRTPATDYIAFDSNQFKARDNKNPTEDADIRYSLSKDSDGRELTEGQKEYFKDSKVVDANGALKVMYHGTPNGDFTVFKDGTYFTENKWYADLYQNPGASSISHGKSVTNPKTYEVYLDIKKPFDISDPEARSIYINDYIKGGNAAGINPYLSDAEYDKINTIDWTEGEDLCEFLKENDYDYDGLVLDEGATGGYGEDVKYRGKSYVIFDPSQVKNVDNVNPTSDPDIRFSLSKAVEESGNLIAMHNVHADKLMAALRLGGLPSPSVAITKADITHDNYGAITMILPKESIDPQADGRNKVYGSDAWTPTISNARTEYEVDTKKARAFEDRLEELSRNVAGGAFVRGSMVRALGIDDVSDQDARRISERLASYDEVRAAYLGAMGKNVEPEYKAKEYSQFGNAALQKYIDRVGAQRLASIVADSYTGDMTAIRAEEEAVKQIIRDAYIEEHAYALNKRPDLKDIRVNLYMEKTVNAFTVEDFIKDAWQFYEEGGAVTEEIDRMATSDKLREAVNTSDIVKWLEPQVAEFLGEPGIYNGKDIFTPSGRRRSFSDTHWSYTAENIVKAMQLASARGETWGGTNANTLIATATPSYKSIDEMHADEGRLKLEDKEAYEAILNELDEALTSVEHDIIRTTEHHSDNTYEEEQIIGDILTQAATGTRTVTAVKRAFSKEGYTISDKQAKSILALYNKAASVPTGYFEAKPERVVGFDEVAVVIIPNNTDPKLKQELLNHGLSIAEYDPDVEGSRQKVVNNFEQYKFSLSRIGEGVVDQNAHMRLHPLEDVLPVREDASVTDTNVGDKSQEVATPENWRDVIKSLREPEMNGEEWTDEYFNYYENVKTATANASVDEVIQDIRSGMSSAELKQKSINASKEYDSIRGYTESENLLKVAIYNQYSLYDSASKNPQKVLEMFGDEFDEDKVPTPETAEATPITTVGERLSAKKGNYKTELESNKANRAQAWANYDAAIAEAQAEYDGLKNKNTKRANNLLRRIDRYKRQQANVDADYAKRISDIESRIGRTSEKIELNEQRKAQLASDIASLNMPTQERKSSDKIAKSLTKESGVNQKKEQRGILSLVKEYVLDNGMVFEDESKKHHNRQLEADWNMIRNARSMAQRFLKKSVNGRRSIVDLEAEVRKKGLTQDFYDYMHHMLNVDRMSLESKAQAKIADIIANNPVLGTLLSRNQSTGDILNDPLFKQNADTLKADVDKLLKLKETKNHPVFGDPITSEISAEEAAKLEKAHPEFKSYAEEIYANNRQLRNMLVEEGIITPETAELWEEMYPHYVPLRRAKKRGGGEKNGGRMGVNAPLKRAEGGNTNIEPLFNSIGLRAEQTYKAILKNRFGVELKNTIQTPIVEADNKLGGKIDTPEGIENTDSLLMPGDGDNAPTFTVFENGEKVTFEITEEMYDAMRPTGDVLSYTNKGANAISNLMRGVLTEYSLPFIASNFSKDIQDVLMNSQHPAQTYAAVPRAIAHIISNGSYLNEYYDNGGESLSFFNNETMEFVKKNVPKEVFMTLTGLNAISKANKVIELVPRLAEYIASREAGQSIEVSMLDAARVTTNFAAGGKLTKMLNRNGATFLNASVQGLAQNIRNIREAKMNGLKGWIGLAAKTIIAGAPALILNNLVWDDDDEYEELSDYIKQNYYVVAKFGDGKFVRVPKGRIVAVIQDAFTQIANAATGDDEIDFESFAQLVINNLVPNNPYEDNVASPIAKMLMNETWYGGDLVPTRLQDVPEAEQYDETTDAISKWLGEKLNFSPYKINYLIDQYTGGIGDILLPMITPESETGDDSAMDYVTAPFRDKFTTDSVLKNQNTSDFYDLKDELNVNANSSKATDDDTLKNKYMNAMSDRISELQKQKREIQSSNLSKSEKYELTRDLQKEIVALTKEAIDSYENLNEVDDTHTEIGGYYFEWYTPEEGEPYWRKMTDSQKTKYLLTKDATGHYVTNGSVHYRLDKDGSWTKISDKDLARQNEVTKELGITPDEYWSKTETSFFPVKNGEYEYAYENPGNYAVAKAVGGYDSYKSYSKELSGIKGDKDENGKTISGSLKAKKHDYIFSLDLDYGQKCILFKSEYPKDDEYNVDGEYNDAIVDYLNSRDDISYSEMKTILEELGATVDSRGNITW
jgi:hypothetical protein